MAKKSLQTRQKLVFRGSDLPQIKPRNPVALAAKQRVAGPHQKNVSTLRQAEKQRLKKILVTGGIEDEDKS